MLFSWQLYLAPDAEPRRILNQMGQVSVAAATGTRRRGQPDRNNSWHALSWAWGTRTQTSEGRKETVAHQKKQHSSNSASRLFSFFYQGANDQGSEKDELLVAEVAGSKLEHLITDRHGTQHVWERQGRKKEPEIKKTRRTTWDARRQLHNKFSNQKRYKI